MQIFLSHATSDRALVDRVKEAVSESNITLYCTEDDVRAGANVHTKIQNKIEHADLVIALLSTAGASSTYVHQEIGFARRAGKLIVPIVSRDVSSRSLGMLEGIEFIAIDGGDSDEAMLRLRHRVEAILKLNDAKDAIALGALLVVLGLLILAMLADG